MGKAVHESHDRQPDSGNPTVRDDKGGLRNRAYYGSRTEARWEINGIATGPYDCMRRISIPTERRRTGGAHFPTSLNSEGGSGGDRKSETPI
jgi:hypothetical protein